MKDLHIPRFSELSAVTTTTKNPKKRYPERGDTLPVGLIAAIRYDYEVELMNVKDISRKYHGLVAYSTCYAIANRRIHPGIVAKEHSLNWCWKARRYHVL